MNFQKNTINLTTWIIEDTTLGLTNQSLQAQLSLTNATLKNETEYYQLYLNLTYTY